MSMANVVRFREIMKTYPIAVLADENRTAIFAYNRRNLKGELQPNPGFEIKNHDLMREASELFWGDDDVFTFIMEHQGLEIGLTGTRVRAVESGQIRIPKKDEVAPWAPPVEGSVKDSQAEMEIDVNTGEVKITPLEEEQPIRAHQKKIEIKTKYLTLSF